MKTISFLKNHKMLITLIMLILKSIVDMESISRKNINKMKASIIQFLIAVFNESVVSGDWWKNKNDRNIITAINKLVKK